LIILGLDTALGACQAAVLDGDKVLASSSEPMLRGHQERLGDLVAQVMRAADAGFADLERLGVTVGPGSFTGVRVGLAFAKGLALALGVPLVGIGTLEALAASVPADGVVTAVIDAKRGQVYIQSFLRGEPLGEPQGLSIQDAGEGLHRRESQILVGPGAGLFDQWLAARVVPIDAADPVTIARLAGRAPAPLAAPRPLYLRAPDARPSP
jgi:tRNA threonylcarbamoyladenosine biosynthesis protein TsaB